jgi:hypothetical protein
MSVSNSEVASRMRSCWCFMASVWKGTHRTSHVMTCLHNDDTVYDIVIIFVFCNCKTTRLPNCYARTLWHSPPASCLRTLHFQRCNIHFSSWKHPCQLLVCETMWIIWNQISSCQVKKRILDELEVPREALYTSTNIYPNVSRLSIWILTPSTRGCVPSLPRSLYRRNDDVSEAGPFKGRQG